MTTQHIPHLINNPNHNNTDFILTANDNPIKQHFFGKRRATTTHTSLPTQFTDAMKLRNMQQEVQKETCQKNSIAKTVYETLHNAILIRVLTFLGVVFTIGSYIKVLSFIIPAVERNPLFLILAIIAIITITICMGTYLLVFGAQKYTEMKHQDTLPYINKKQKALLKTIPVAYMDNDNLKSCDTSMCRVQHATKSILQLQEENHEYNIDITRFAQAYDNYAEVLIFAYANKEAISKDLLKKYVKELDALAEIVVEEARTVRNEVKEIQQAVATELQKSKDIEKELATIRQHEIDTVATAIMPLRFQ